MNRIILGIVCILFSGFACADVFHPEDATIRGHIGEFGDDVCFNNDGNTDFSNCPDGLEPNEGYVYIENDNTWRGHTSFGINGCGITAEDPVSTATCPLVLAVPFATCTPNQYVLVQTKVSGHYFAVKAGNSCGTFLRPEAAVIFPCLSTDAFDTVNGCAPPKPTLISVEEGYIKLDTIDAAPAVADCDDNDITHHGRMVVDSVNGLIYICTQAGWIAR